MRCLKLLASSQLSTVINNACGKLVENGAFWWITFSALWKTIFAL